jgi:hypothetical protein
MCCCCCCAITEDEVESFQSRDLLNTKPAAALQQPKAAPKAAAKTNEKAAQPKRTTTPATTQAGAKPKRALLSGECPMQPYWGKGGWCCMISKPCWPEHHDSCSYSLLLRGCFVGCHFCNNWFTHVPCATPNKLTSPPAAPALLHCLSPALPPQRVVTCSTPSQLPPSSSPRPPPRLQPRPTRRLHSPSAQQHPQQHRPRPSPSAPC